LASMRRMGEPPDPRDPSPSEPGSGEVSAAAQRAREQVREEFEGLRAEIEDLHAEDGGDGPPVAGGFGDRARASAAVLALTAAIAAAAANFALNGGRTPTDGSVSIPPTSGEPEPGVITADRGSAEAPFPLLSLIAPGLQIDTLGSNAAPPGAGPGPSPLFVVGKPVPVSGHGSPGEDVGGADPVVQSPTPTKSPTPTAPAPEPDAPQQLAYSPPAGGGPGDGGDSGGGPGDGAATSKGPGDGGKGPKKGGKGPGGKPSNGGAGGNAGTPGGGGGNGLGKGHIKAKGKGHGESPGKGHEKDQGGGGVVEGGSGGKGSPGNKSGSHGHGGHGHGGVPGGGPPTPTAAPADPGPPEHGPDSGSDGDPGKSGNPGNGHGDSSAPGQSGK
jgi:hypothetical protein